MTPIVHRRHAGEHQRAHPSACIWHQGCLPLLVCGAEGHDGVTVQEGSGGGSTGAALTVQACLLDKIFSMVLLLFT